MVRQLDDLVAGLDPRLGGTLNARAWKELTVTPEAEIVVTNVTLHRRRRPACFYANWKLFSDNWKGLTFCSISELLASNRNIVFCWLAPVA